MKRVLSETMTGIYRSPLNSFVMEFHKGSARGSTRVLKEIYRLGVLGVCGAEGEGLKEGCGIM